MKTFIFFTGISILITRAFFGQAQNTNAYCSTYNQRLDSVIVYNYSDIDSICQDKMVYGYDEAGNRILEVEHRWNSELNDWYILDKVEWSYDEAGYRILEIDYQLDSFLFAWVASNKVEYNYDDAGNLILEVDSRWNSELKGWIGELKYEYSYNEVGNQTLVLIYDWDKKVDDWIVRMKNEYSYDDTGNRVLEIFYDRNSISNDWVATWKWEYTYDEAKNRIIKIVFHWEPELNDWIHSNYIYAYNKFEYYYDDSGNLILFIGYDFRSEYYDWIEKGKVEWSYTNDGNLTNEVHSYWEPINEWVGDWGIWHKTEYSYNEAGNLVNEAYYLLDSESNLTLVSKSVYYYSTLPLEVKQLVNKNFKLYPNPTSDRLNITGINYPAKITISNLNGQLILDKVMVGTDTRIDLSTFKSGIYFITIKSDDFVTTRKIVKH